jgi:hypothetical protein
MIMPFPEFDPEVIEKLIRMGPPPRYFDDAFTARVMKEMSEKGLLRSKTETTKKLDPKLVEYSVLVLIMNKKATKPKLPILMEVSVEKFRETETNLVKLKLVEEVGGELEVTELGRRFMQDVEQSKKTEK